MRESRTALPWSGRTPTKFYVGPGAADAYSGSPESRLGRLVLFDPNTVISGELCGVWNSREDSRSAYYALSGQLLDNDHGLGTAHEIATILRAGEVDNVVAIGGGSVLDIAKIATVIASGATPMTNPGPRSGLALVGPPDRRRLPLAAIPTTLGTGSETSAVARLSLPEGKSRLLVSLALQPTTVVLDPRATDSLPSEVAALGAVEILLRLIGPVIGPYPCHGALVQWAVASAQRVTSLADSLLDRTKPEGNRSHARLALAVISASSHRLWGLIGRSPFAFRLWYLADAAAVVGRTTKMRALAWLLPTYLKWVLSQQIDQPWGDRQRAQHVVLNVFAGGYRTDDGPAGAANAARTLLRRWRIPSLRLSCDPAEMAATALSSWRRQLAGLDLRHLTRFFADVEK